LSKYGQEAYDLTMEMFDQIPLACLLNNKFLCVHGGISHDLKTVYLALFSWTTSRKSTASGRFPRTDFSAT
jgi:hypothetical protein